MAVLGMVSLPRLALATETKVAVVDTVQANLGLKLGARQAVAAALDELSVRMVPMEDITAEDAACNEASCYVEVAKRVGATHLLLVQGVANPAGYRLALDVRDGETGRSLGTDGKDCELCSEDQFASTVQERVSKLWTRIAQEQAAPPPPPPPAPPVEQAVADETPAVFATEAEGTPWWKQRTPLMGAGLGALGVLAATFGIYYIAVDGNSAEESEILPGKAIMLRDTGKWGWSLLSVGVVSIAAGSAMIIWGREDGSNVQVSVGPSSIGLLGKF